MAEIVKSDRSGRIVIPKSLRLELGIKKDTTFILTKMSHGQLLLQKLDVDEIARKLEEELAGKDIDAIVQTVRKEIHEKIRANYPDLLT
ncbi:MAG: AbrB/MazE/SpoVT family DNA-binding domain-containing protein [Candidatus Bathyarchaeota archaeon]|nr:AbrB/MazE/SpoVT family DNA-binding domain-containing protein [Candidatus Bathyarchaeota archaeon]